MSRLDKSLDTYIGSGNQISGGQKQRIALARTLLRNPKILLLDEATSALDRKAEREIQDILGITFFCEALKNKDPLSIGKTMILIDHKLRILQNCSKIFVIKKGGIAEEGTHEALMEQKGIYYHLFQVQMEPEISSLGPKTQVCFEFSVLLIFKK